MPVDEMLLRRVCEALPRYRYMFGGEVTLHAGMAEALTAAGIAFQREVVAGPRDRFDFLVPEGIVIEAKVKGSLPDALRQCDRYAARDDVAAVILASSRQWGGIRPVAALHGKPFRMVQIRGAAF